MIATSKEPVNYAMKLFTACAMVLVVVGHTPSRAGFAGPFNLFDPYGFHVAAFIFVSGYFYHPRHEHAPGRYLLRKTKRLIVPLLAISAVYGCIVTFALHPAGFTFGEDLSLFNLVVAPFTDGHQYQLNYAMWFIAPLYLTEVANLGLRKVLTPWKAHSAKEIALFVLYLGLGIAAVTYAGPDKLPAGFRLLACRTAFFMACFGMGRVYRILLEKHDTASNVVYFAVVLTAQLAVVCACGGRYTYVPSWAIFPNNALLIFLETALGIAFLLRSCKVLEPALGRSRAVATIADNSYSIMCHHLVGFFIVNCLYAALATAGVVDGFDFAAFHADIDYRFFPLGFEQFGLVYTAAGIGAALGIHACWTQAKRIVTQAFPARDAR